jgi:hypothetical protein
MKIKFSLKIQIKHLLKLGLNMFLINPYILLYSQEWTLFFFKVRKNSTIFSIIKIGPRR